MNPLNLLNPDYLLDITPRSTFLFFWPLLTFFALFFAASFYIKKQIQAHRNPRVAMKLLGGIPVRMREFAVLGVILAFFRDQNIPWLATRLWLVLLFLATIGYGVWVWKNYQKNYLKLVREEKVQKSEDEYLPKPKRKKKKKR